MRIQLETDGGFAPMPGLGSPLAVDTTDLRPEDAAALQQLMDTAGFFARPRQAGGALAGTADRRHYTLTVVDGERRHAVSFADPVTDTPLAALRDFVRAHARGT